jgi:two-component system CheB/CheR fusion protein
MRVPPSRIANLLRANLRILIVDDDRDTLDTVCEVLRKAGANVRAASSAAEAMQAIAGFKPQVLVCDLAMPVEDGFRLIANIRELGPDRGGNIPAIALTALAGKDDASRALAAGYQLHLRKPIGLSRLAQAIAFVTADETPAAPPAGD